SKGPSYSAWRIAWALLELSAYTYSELGSLPRQILSTCGLSGAGVACDSTGGVGSACPQAASRKASRMTKRGEVRVRGIGRLYRRQFGLCSPCYNAACEL